MKANTLYNKKRSLTCVSLVLSLFTLIAYHIPFFRHVAENVDSNLNGVWIFAGLAVVMLTLNFFFYYLVLYLGRFVGKCLLAFTFISNSICYYFIAAFNVLITDKMMGNVFNTKYSEASGFLGWPILPYIIFLGILPCIYIFCRKIEYGSLKRFFTTIGVSLGLAIAIGMAHMPNWPWIDRNATQLGSLLMPWSYTVNTVRYHNKMKKLNRKEIPLPDATIVTDSRDVCVLVIGESARRSNFSLYGYEKPTNPLLSQDGVTALIANANATYTTAGVKAIVSHKQSDELYEILPNYLYRNGVDVTWRTNNWGEPPVHIQKYYKSDALKERYPEADENYDGILLAGLREEILECDNKKMLIVLHTSTSHGPTYYKKYPPEFETFTPVCTTVEMSTADHDELMNAYDNTIIYTDYLLHSIIEILRSIPEARSCMIYVSDHGESLGENNLYMHGVPMKMAPKEQIEIPFIVWSSSGEIDAEKTVDQYNIFHSVLSFLGIDSPVYDSSLDIF